MENAGKTKYPKSRVSTDVVPASGLVEQLYSQLEEKVRALRPYEDVSQLEKAYRMALDAHKDQFRDSGEPYIVHPLNVALILADMQMDLVCLETGLLHDTVEDTRISLDQIRKEFGDEVAGCVDGVTKLSKLHLYSREERQAESVRKMLLAMVNDIRVVIVKLADRLHNMRTLGVASAGAPGAHGAGDARHLRAHRAPLGMGKIRGELEDLSFQYLEPEASAELLREMESQRQQNEEFLEKMRHEVELNLRRENIPARVEGRIKRAYSVYQKMKRQKIGLDQVYDLAGAAHHHRFGEELLRGAGRHSQRVASHTRPHQGFHRDSPPQPVSVAAHFGDRPGRPLV